MVEWPSGQARVERVTAGDNVVTGTTRWAAGATVSKRDAVRGDLNGADTPV